MRLAATRLAIELARKDLLSFILLLDPTLSLGPHHRIICDALMDVERGVVDRIGIFLPPRSSKSTITSIYFAAWCLGRNPDWQWLQISHSIDLAMKFGRSVRDIIYDKRYQAIFPGIKIRRDNRAADNWALDGYKGIFIAAGVNTKIAGRGADIAVLDDPISEQEAYSPAKRDAVNEWYPAGLRGRLQPQGRIAIVQTRWAEDDLSGYLLNMEKTNPFADHWKVVKIPALNTSESIPLLKAATVKLKLQGYIPPEYPDPELGESFWPAPSFGCKYFWSTQDLIRTKNNLPAYQFDAVYMQSPTTAEGGILKAAYWKPWVEELPKIEYSLISMDTAFSTKTSADYSAFTRWGAWKDENGTMRLMLLGGEKGRWAFPELKQKCVELYVQYRPDAFLIEKKASGQSLIQELKASGYPVFEYNPGDKDKEARAHAVSPLFAAGQIYVPTIQGTDKPRPWATDVIEECRQFPNGAHDDFVDTVTQAVLWFRGSGWVSHPKDHTVSPWEDEDKPKHRRSFY